MTPKDSIKLLSMLGDGDRAPLDAAEWQRVTTRLAWVKQTMTKLRAARRKADAAWDAMFDGLPDDLSEEELEALPTPPEQAEVDTLWAEMRAVADEDRWPREMYFGGI